jgi:hypothetical protein
MAVYGYARVSTARQANEGESLEVQRRQIEGYAHMHGLPLEEIVVEEGVSGSIPVAERPAAGPLFVKLTKGDVVIAPNDLWRHSQPTPNRERAGESMVPRGVGGASPVDNSSYNNCECSPCWTLVRLR